MASLTEIKPANSYIQTATHQSAQDLPPQPGISLADVQTGKLEVTLGQLVNEEYCIK
jgi:hypothetical protein